MSDLKKEEATAAQVEVERLAQPALETEAEILNGNKAREEAQKAIDEECKKDIKEEAKLPKLNAADFRTYNSMAEHMEYFVRFALTFKAFTPSISQYNGY